MNLNQILKAFLILFLFLASYNFGYSQKIDTTSDRVVTGLKIPFPYLGTLKTRSTNQINSSNWLLGCETLDRDYANYDAYKDYLVPLGIKKIRLQGGWDKTEKIKGVYDWTWMDHIINDAVSKGLSPWFQLSYGNHLYPGGGGSNLGAGMPHSKEALTAWDNWVVAAVNRYKDKVFDWEIWNEPNFSDNIDNTPKITAALNIRTIDIIKKIQPKAKVSGLAIGHIDLAYADEFFKILHKKKKLELFDNITYHDYVYNPDSNYPKVEQLRSILDKYCPTVKLRQGENGAPSGARLGGALGDYDWSELSQAKWDSRRMLGDLGHDIESSVFTIIEIAYTAGPITKLNVKGLLKSDSTKKVIRPKIAYYTVQNITSLFDDHLTRIKNMEKTFNTSYIPENGEVHYSINTDRSFAVYGYKNKDTQKQLFTIWADEAIPNNTVETKNLEFTVLNANITNPVFIDLITGKVYEIPTRSFKLENGKITFKNLPVYDAPIVVADKSIISYQ